MIMEIMEEKKKKGSIWSIFMHVDGVDLVLMTFGFIGAVGDGFSMPITFVITNKLVNNIGTFFSFISPQAFTKIINENVNVLCMVGAGAWVLCFLEGYCWTRTAERQASRLRNRYLKAVLRQDVSYFDLHVGSTSEVITSVSNDSLIIQNVISEKVPNFVMNTSLFVGSYVASFLLLWRLAIVVLPFIVSLIIPGLMYRRILMGLARKLTLEYNKAASISEQAISSIRTVYAFVGEPKTMSKFSTALEGSVKLGIRQGLKKIKLKGRDYATAYGFCQEILYLKKLKGKDIIIQLIDFEVTDKALLHEVMNGSISNKDSRVKDDGYIYMVLEYGEIDLAHMLSQKWREIEGTNSTMDQNWLRFYWQVGTLSYMRVMQMGILQSDIWSLGCILYQMVYGRTPFSEYKTFWAKFKVISDPSPEITYGPISNPWLLDLMKKCLAWDRNERWRIPEHPFLVPPIQQQLPPALEQNCKFTHENVPSLCLEFQQLLEDPAAISRDNQFRILSQISSICQQLQEHLTKMS